MSPTDTIHRSGGRAELLEQDPPPYVPGMDIAGVINEIGEGVDHVAVGDAVMGIVAPTASHGGYSSSIVLPARSVARTEGVICSRGMHSSDERAYSSVRARSSRSSEGCNSCHHGSCWGVRWLHGATRCASGYGLSQIRLRQMKTLSAHSVPTRSFAGVMTLPTASVPSCPTALTVSLMVPSKMNSSCRQCETAAALRLFAAFRAQVSGASPCIRYGFAIQNRTRKT